jgi:ribonuclease-3
LLIRKLYNYFLSPDKNFVRRIRHTTGFIPLNTHIFKLAFAHKSNGDDKEYAINNNERLEYLGDSILSTIVAEYLFKKYPNSNEGFLTKMRSKIVKRKTLNQIADDMGLDMLLKDYNDTKLSDSMKGNALEALVGAIYLEKGYRRTKNIVITRILRRYLNIHRLESLDDNYKSQLLEWCQKQGNDIDYRLKEKYKFDNRDRFRIAVFVNGKEISTSEDFNKKSAEQSASKKAIYALGIHEVQTEEIHQ